MTPAQKAAATRRARLAVSTFERFSVVKLGHNSQGARVYLQGAWLARAGFKRDAGFDVTLECGRVVVNLSPNGSRRVSGKGETPVVDLNSAQLATALAGAAELEVRTRAGAITITRARVERQRAARVRNGLEGSLFSGAGLLSQAAVEAGYRPAFAVEWDPRHAEIFERNHPSARMFNMDIAQVPVAELPQVELLTVGIPCEPFSKMRIAVWGEAGQPPEAHELGDMVFWALRVIDAVNPHKVVIEEVPGFLESGAGWILRHALERMGYHVASQVLDSTEHGGLTARRRAVIVATTDGEPVFPEARPSTRTVAEILDPVPDDSPEWFDRSTKAWLFKHAETQRAAGNGFSFRILTPESTSVPAITKRYFAGQGHQAVVAHPSRPETYRWLRVDEVKRLHGLPASYDLGAAKTTAGEVLGQGVVVSTFRQVIERN